MERALDAMSWRGPDARDVVEVDGWTLGHLRLAILDLDPRSDQPMRRGATTLVFNGELWNYRELRAELAAEGREFTTEGDTEVVAWAIDAWGAEAAFRRFNGMIAAAWTAWDGSLGMARDRFGEVPLHYGVTSDGGCVFASELRALLALGAHPRSVRWVGPGEILTVSPEGKPSWSRYHELDATPLPDTFDEAATKIVGHLADACRERSISDVPVACLISGGIDSSAVAKLLLPHVPDLALYTAVHQVDSLDHRCAREMADALGVELREVHVPAPTADDLAGIVGVIEMSAKAQVEIAWACSFLARQMHDDGVKVVFTGEGSDELWASYNRSYFGVRDHPEGWHGFRRDTFLAQHRKNFARCNKVFMRWSVESRLPFLHPALVEWGVGLARDSVFGQHFDHKPSKTDVSNVFTKEKGHMRAGFADLLPERIVRRDKEAFQSGAGLVKAAAEAVADPQRFYRAEFARLFGPVKI